MSYKEYAVRVYPDGRKEWRHNSKLHREDGPAIEGPEIKGWYFNGKLHREDGPAVENTDGSRGWYLNGNLHREDGPAVERVDGKKQWWINNESMSEAEFLARKNSCAGKIVEIDGKKYKLIEVA